MTSVVKKFVLALSLGAVLFSAAGCGGLDNDEQQAADSLAKAWNGASPTKSKKANNKCIAETWVERTGLESLRKDKVVDDKFAATGDQPPEKMSRDSATGFGEAVALCFNIKASKADVKKGMPGVSTKDLDAYLNCMDKIDRDLIAQAVRDGRLNKSGTTPQKDLDVAVKNCQPTPAT